MRHIALALAALSLAACVGPNDFIAQCGGNPACAQGLANAENNRRATIGAVGVGTAALVGAAASAASTPSYGYFAPPPPVAGGFGFGHSGFFAPQPAFFRPRCYTYAWGTRYICN